MRPPLLPLSPRAQMLEQNATYIHSGTGKRYRILGVGRHTETLEEVVIYQAVEGEPHIWVRPVEMFQEEVILEGKKVPRFQREEELGSSSPHA